MVAAGLAERAEVQVAYAIGVPTRCRYGRHVRDREGRPGADRGAVADVFDLRPAAIIRDLDLTRPIFRTTSNYGHFGREEDSPGSAPTAPPGCARPAGSESSSRSGPIAKVHPLVTARAVDRAFDYAVPDDFERQVIAGARVRIPLGAREVEGVVAAVEDGDGTDLKPVLEVTGQLPAPLLELAGWVAADYGSTMARALALVIRRGRHAAGWRRRLTARRRPRPPGSA